MEIILAVVGLVAGLFWLWQLKDLLFRDVGYFESHTHKLVWFLVLFVGNIIGAIWYYRW